MSSGNLLEDVQLDANKDDIVFASPPPAPSLAIHSAYPGGHTCSLYEVVEGFQLDWIHMGYDPENYSQAQLDSARQPHRRVGRRPPSKEKKASKKQRTRHS